MSATGYFSPEACCKNSFSILGRMDKDYLIRILNEQSDSLKYRTCIIIYAVITINMLFMKNIKAVFVNADEKS